MFGALLGHYTPGQFLTLITMILSGAARTVGNKIYYQFGYDDPLLVVVITLIAHGFAIPVYLIAKALAHDEEEDEEEDTDMMDIYMKELEEEYEKEHENNEGGQRQIEDGIAKNDEHQDQQDDKDREKYEQEHREKENGHHHHGHHQGHHQGHHHHHHFHVPVQPDFRASLVLMNSRGSMRCVDVDNKKVSRASFIASAVWRPELDLGFEDEEQEAEETQAGASGTLTAPASASTLSSSIASKAWRSEPTSEEQKKKNEDNNTTNTTQDPKANARTRNVRGSVAGLTHKSREAVNWVRRLPKWSYPMFTSITNMLDIIFRVTAFLFVPASVGALLMNGIELIASLFVAKHIRKRTILRERWFGAATMVVGLVLVGLSGLSSLYPDDNYGLGMLFILLKVAAGVSNTMAQELFTQEGKYPATLLLGLEGVYGAVMALGIYFAVGPALGYEPTESFKRSFASGEAVAHTVGFMAINLVAALYSLFTTVLSSAMTAMLWRQFRGLVVWTAAVIVFYATGNEDLGEEWSIPSSIYILSGFTVMLGAVNVYYGAIACLKDPKSKQVA